MTDIATKNGAVIVKDGSVGTDCGCCGGWYCVKSTPAERCCSSLNVSVTYSGLSGAAWQAIASDFGPTQYGLTIVDAPTSLSGSGVANRSTVALDMSGCDHDCMYSWSRELTPSPIAAQQSVVIVQNLRVSPSSWITGLVGALPLRFPDSGQSPIYYEGLPECCEGSSCEMEIPHAVSGSGYVAPSWHATAPASAWYQGCNYQTIYKSDAGLLSAPLESLTGQKWTLYLRMPQTACKSGMRNVKPVVGVTVEVQ